MLKFNCVCVLRFHSRSEKELLHPDGATSAAQRNHALIQNNHFRFNFSYFTFK